MALVQRHVGQYIQSNRTPQHPPSPFTQEEQYTKFDDYGCQKWYYQSQYHIPILLSIDRKPPARYQCRSEQSKGQSFTFLQYLVSQIERDGHCAVHQEHP